jgi:hypothetical protein
LDDSIDVSLAWTSNSWWGIWKGFYFLGEVFIPIVHFLPRGRKRNQKKTPVSRFFLRVADTGGARGNSPANQRAQTVRTLYSVRIVDARRGTEGIKTGTGNYFL